MLRKMFAAALALLMAISWAHFSNENAALADGGEQTLQLVALEAGGSVIVLEDSGYDMRETITLRPDGTAHISYSYDTEKIETEAVWQSTKYSYTIDLQADKWVLIWNSDGFYALAGDGYNLLFLPDGSGGLARDTQLSWPSALGSMNKPFSGDLSAHIDALQFVGKNLDGIDLTIDDNAYSIDNGRAALRFRGSESKDIGDMSVIYDSNTENVYAYVLRINYSELDDTAHLNDLVQNVSGLQIAMMAAMFVDVGGDEAALVEQLYSRDWETELNKYVEAFKSLQNNERAETDYHGYKLTMLRENTREGYLHDYWIIMHDEDGLNRKSTAYKPSQQPTQRPVQPAANPTQRPTQSPGASAAGEWICPSCGTKNGHNFCTECGTKRPDNKCPSCGTAFDPANRPNFCPECGQKLKAD